MFWTRFNRTADRTDADVLAELNQIRTGQATVIKNALDPALHQSLKNYVQALKAQKETLMRFDGHWGGRWVKNNDPLVCFVHDFVTPLIYSRLKISVKPSYNFVSCYVDGGHVPKHTDRPQCKYTFDYMVEQTEGLQWPLYVCNEPILLEENDAVIYSGTDMLHWRDGIPKGHQASLIFFHYVDSNFPTSLD